MSLRGCSLSQLAAEQLLVTPRAPHRLSIQTVHGEAEFCALLVQIQSDIQRNIRRATNASMFFSSLRNAPVSGTIPWLYCCD